MNIVVVDYRGGNVQSLLFSLERLGVQATHTSDAATILAADKVLFPGEGEASSAMQELRAAGLDRVLSQLTQPFLGICLGMQLLGRHSEENDTELLGLLPFNVVRFAPEAGLKVPHMGWNTLHTLTSPLFAGIPEHAYAYFVHSYAAPLGDYTIGTADYGHGFSAAVQYRNFYGAQFHVEKSGSVGTRILENFLTRC